MGYLDKVKKAVNPKASGVVPTVVGAVEYGAASYGFGYLQGRYRYKVGGIPAELLAGLAGKALVLVGGDVMGYLPGLMPHVDILANAGIGAYMHTLGAGHGAKHGNVVRAVGAVDEKKLAAVFPNATVLGALPKAPRGDFLSASELAELAR